MSKRMLNRSKLMFYVWRLRFGKSAIAAHQLGSLGDRRAVPPLIAALEADHGYLGAEAALALVRLGDRRAVGALARALTSAPAAGDGGRFFVRDVVGALVALGGPQAVEPLIQALETTDNSYLKVKCCFALAEFGDRAAIGALVSQHAKAPVVLTVVDQDYVVLNDVIPGQGRDTDVRRAAAYALKALGHPNFSGFCDFCEGYGSVIRRSRQGVTDAMGLHGHVEHTGKEYCKRCSGIGTIVPKGLLDDLFGNLPNPFNWGRNERR